MPTPLGASLAPELIHWLIIMPVHKWASNHMVPLALAAAAIHSFDSRAGAGVVCCAGCHRSMPELRAGSKWLGCRKSLPIPQPCQTGNSDQPATALGGPLMVTRLRITCPPSLGGTHHGPYCDHPPLLTLSLRAEEAPLAGLAALSPTAIRVVRRSLRMRTRYHCVLHTV
jgi:hypothetical protein